MNNNYFLGVGIGQLVGTVSVISYYCSLIALTLHYLFSSMQKNLPWGTCKPEWENCVDSKPSNSSLVSMNGSKSSSEFYFL